MKILLKVVYLMLGSSCNYTLIAQIKYPSIISVNADSKQMEGIIWDWSFGEQLMVHTLYSSKNLMLTTGFLQNDFWGGVDYKLLALTSPFKIGPNPFIQNLKINSDQNGLVISKIEMNNEQGQLLKIVQGPFSGIQFEQTLSFASVNTGIYFVAIHYVVGKSNLKKEIFKVIKQ